MITQIYHYHVITSALDECDLKDTFSSTPRVSLHNFDVIDNFIATDNLMFSRAIA